MSGTAFMDADAIRERLGARAASAVRGLEVMPSIDSTNSELLRRELERRHACIIIADRQTTGRGRRGRQWHSPSGGNIYLSMGWVFDPEQAALNFLPLIVAVHVCAALERTGLARCDVKWPNDIFVDGRKLAGILVESRAGPEREFSAVIGVGLNVAMPEPAAGAIDQPWTDLATASGRDISRIRVAAHLIDGLIDAVEETAAFSFEDFEPRWRLRDLLRDKPVAVHASADRTSAPQSGFARGIGRNGGLIFESQSPDMTTGLRQLLAGEVSIRLDEHLSTTA